MYIYNTCIDCIDIIIYIYLYSILYMIYGSLMFIEFPVIFIDFVESHSLFQLCLCDTEPSLSPWSTASQAHPVGSVGSGSESAALAMVAMAKAVLPQASRREVTVVTDFVRWLWLRILSWVTRWHVIGEESLIILIYNVVMIFFWAFRITWIRSKCSISRWELLQR